MDRVEYSECRQQPNEEFEDFHHRLKEIARGADFCLTCYDDRLKTSIIAGLDDAETRRKILAINPAPDLQRTLDICRSEKSARNDESRMSKQRVSRVADI